MMDWEMWYHLAGHNWWKRAMFHPDVIRYIVFAWIFAMGACFGSFLNVCIWRIPRGESIAKASSHCTSCGSAIKWYDNIPVLSYIILRGKCRYCRTPYSMSYFLVELAFGIMSVLLVIKTGVQQQTPAAILMQAAMLFFALGCGVIDWKNRTIPDKMNYSAIVCALFFTLLMPGFWGSDSRWEALLKMLISGVVPAGIVFVFAAVGKFVSKKTVIGWGDVKFIAATGMLIGLPGALFALLAGSVAGSISGLITARKANAEIAFGPWLAAGAVIWVYFGNNLLDAYKNFCLLI